MVALIFYGLTLILVNFLCLKFAKTFLQILGLAFLISASLCGIYQIGNYLIYGPDKFIAIAIATQLSGSFIFSVLFGVTYLKTRKN